MHGLIKLFKKCILIFFGSFLLTACSTEKSDNSIASNQEFHLVQNALEERVKNKSFSGNMVVLHEGTPVYSFSGGLASRELNVDHNPDSVFLTGSISKYITLVTTLKAVEHGVIDLNDKITNVFSELNLKDAGDITIEHLLTHYSGLPGMRSDAMELKSFEIYAGENFTKNNFIKYVFEQPREATPGERFTYGNLGYDVLQLALEKKMNSSYADIIKKLVLDPLKMTESGINNRPNIIPNRSAPYDLVDDQFYNAKQSDGGSFYSTTQDLAKLASETFNNSFLNESQLKYVKDYGLYKHVIRVSEAKDLTILWFNGIDMGYSAEFGYLLDTNHAYGIAANISPAFYKDIREKLAQTIGADRLQ